MIQQPSINQIPIKDDQYKNVKLANIKTIKSIYRQGQLCDVKFVKIEQQTPQKPIFLQAIKQIKYALKTISKQKIRTKSQNYQREYISVYNEILSLYLMDHPNIVKIYWHFQDQQAIYILTQYGGTKLLSHSKKSDFDQSKIKDIFKQICLAVQELHSKSIMHRDLSLQNIVISTQTNQVKIIDFGYANQFSGGRTTALGTLAVMAPEVYHQKKYNSKADIWSLGIILFELFHKKNPFANQNQNYTEEEYSQKRDKLNFHIDESKMSLQAKQLIEKMLSLSPEKRPSVQKILKSKWITGLEEEEQQQDIESPFKIKQSGDNRKTVKQKKQLSDFSGSQKIPNPFDKSLRGSERQDFFQFDNILSKMSMDNSVGQLQNRLKHLISIHSQQLSKKKKLALQLLKKQKCNIQQEKLKLNNQ